MPQFRMEGADIPEYRALDEFTATSKRHGEVTAYLGDNGKIYF